MFIIRADGNAKIGAGHLMRCLTIGEAVGKQEQLLFLCADEDSAALVESRGFRVGTLHTDYRMPETEPALWEPWITDAQNTVLVDSYYVTDAYLAALGRYGRVYLMDDLQRHAYPVDGVINYNLFADLPVYRKLYAGRDVRFWLGGEYVPLRRQFQNTAYQVKDAVEDVLITTGGGDADNLAGLILDAIYRRDIVYHVLVGRFSPHFESWRERAGGTPNIRIHYDVQDMAGLMCKCDLAVSAGGSTLYELAAVGVPFLCFSYAENQEALTDYMERAQAAGCAGAWHRDAVSTLERMRMLFGELCENRILRQQYSERGRRLVDGLGAYRLAEVLCGGR